MQWIHVCLKFVLVIYLNCPIHAVWATFWNQLEYCNMHNDWRVKRGGGYSLEVPCQYLFKGYSLAVKWHSKTLFRVEQFENDAFWKRCFLVWTEKKMLSEALSTVIRFQTKTELFCSVSKNICVHNYRFRIVFTSPHYNVVSVLKTLLYPQCACSHELHACAFQYIGPRNWRGIEATW